MVGNPDQLRSDHGPYRRLFFDHLYRSTQQISGSCGAGRRPPAVQPHEPGQGSQRRGLRYRCGLARAPRCQQAADPRVGNPWGRRLRRLRLPCGLAAGALVRTRGTEGHRRVAGSCHQSARLRLGAARERRQHRPQPQLCRPCATLSGQPRLRSPAPGNLAFTLGRGRHPRGIRGARSVP